MMETKDKLPEPTLSQTPDEFAFKEGVINKKTEKISKDLLRKCYDAIRILIMKYVDIDEKYSKIIALWVIGTYFHKEFETFPFLFINAMRGSGKTRLLKLIESLVWNGKITNNLSEAVLFRTAERNTILIDEFEQVTSKEKTALRELLQSGYKRGSIVERIKKSYSKEGEQMVVEKFKIYTPIVMANIKGIDETLGDRCITIILEKSNDKARTKLIEDFSKNSYFKQLKRTLEQISVVSVGVYPLKSVYVWNTYIYTTYTTTLPSLPSLPTLTNENDKINEDEIVIKSEILKLFQRIDELGIDGRNLELIFPLIILSQMIGDNVLDDILEVSKDIIDEKRKEEFTQSLDVSLINYISKKESEISYFPLKELVSEFKVFVDVDSESEEINNKWMGNALKRLNLITDKRRVAEGMQVVLNVSKAKDKIRMFHTKDEENGKNDKIAVKE